MTTPQHLDDALEALHAYIAAHGGVISATTGQHSMTAFYQAAGAAAERYKAALRKAGLKSVLSKPGSRMEYDDVGHTIRASLSSSGTAASASSHPPQSQQSSQGSQQQRSRLGPPAGAPQVKCTVRVVKMVTKEAGDTFGFFQVHESSIQTVTAALGAAAVDKEHFFSMRFLPSVGGGYQLPVSRGDTLSCLLGRDQKPAKSGRDGPQFFPKQLRLAKCEKLTGEQMGTFLDFISATAASNAEVALLALATCSAVWRHVMALRTLSPEAVRQVLETLHAIFPSHALEEKKRDLYRSVSGSVFVGKDGPLTLFLRASKDSEASEHDARLQLVAVAIEEMVSLVPESARPLYGLITEFYWGDSQLLLGLIRRLWPSSMRTEQLLWHELPLVMSPRELLGEIDPLSLTPAVVPTGVYSTPSEYYDTYYRLHRYEGFGQLRNGIQALLSGKLDPRDMKVYKDVAVQGVRFGNGAGAGMAIALACARFEMAPPLPRPRLTSSLPSPGRYKPLAKSGYKLDEIMYGNLVCLSLGGSFEDALWAVVEDCDVDERGRACVFVSLCTQDNAHDDLTALLLLLRCTTTLMAESPTYFRAVQPVLRALKQHDVSTMPFELELVYGERGPPPAYITPASVVDARVLYSVPGAEKTSMADLGRMLQTLTPLGEPQPTTFDSSQRHAIRAALTQRIAVIQGPPGTGKSTVGRAVAMLLLSMDTRPKGPILVITYKNHSLDEFLEGCIKAGMSPSEIVRVGSRSKSTVLQGRNLKQLLKFGSPLVSGKDSAVEQQTNDTARAQRQELESLIPQLKALSARRRDASHISVHTALGAFLSRADGRQLEQMWLHPKLGLRSAARDVAQLAALLEKTLPDLYAECGDSEYFSCYREACRYCALSAQRALSVQPASQVGLLWEAHLHGVGTALTISGGLEKALLQAGHVMINTFKKWLPPSRDFEHIQKRVRPAVLPDAIAASVDASISLVETSDMVDTVAVAARRRMAGEDDGGGFRSSAGFVEISSRSNQGETRLDVLEQPLTPYEKQNLRSCEDIWQRAPNDIPLLLAHLYMEEHLQEIDENLRSLNQEYTAAARSLVEIEEKRKAEVLSTMKIVGMTSTGAALNQQALASLKPGIIIVEEAAELLESQLLAVLQPSVQHLIMIGDHEQLRPGVENYELVRKKQYDVSMFERLCNNGMLSATLAMQSRMRPEMVELLRDVYPDVKSHERVREPQHDVPACLRHSMFFWTHNSPEVAERSCGNEVEVRMIMKLVQWLTAEGVEPEKVTVLAAYSAQVKKLRDAVKLVPGLMHVPSGGGQQQQQQQHQQQRPAARLSVVTIDEFQGDENDIIICSLVRSCPEDRAPGGGRRSIGYLSVRNRLVVAASRAKQALVFVGNAEWLSARTADLRQRGSTPRLARWDLLAEHMEKQSLVGAELPVVCPRHPDSEILLSSATLLSGACSGAAFSFDDPRPVRCPRPCTALMECGQHACQLGWCHPDGDEPHAASECHTMVCFVHAPCGHKDRRRCCDREPECEKVIKFAFAACGHPRERKCCVPESAVGCGEYVPMQFKGCGHTSTRRCAEPEASQKCAKPCAKKLACGHDCPLRCFEPCSSAEASCKACAARKKVEEEERKRQIEAGIKQAKAQAVSEARVHRERGGFFRKRLHSSDPAYMEACRIVHQNQQPDHANPIVVVGVEQVYNAKLQAKFFECRQGLVDPTPAPMYKFHGTDTAAVDGICETGFRQPDPAKPNMDKKSGGTKLPMYGHGVYFASDSTKAAQREYTQGSNSLLVCQMLLGKSLMLEEPSNHLDKKSIRKKGYDSVFAPAGTAVRFDEYIVYDARQCVVEWVVHFKPGTSKPKTTPWSMGGASIGQATCRELVGSKLGSKDCRELDEFTFAFGHYMRLLAGGGRAVKQIDVYDSPQVDAKYRAKKDEFRAAKKSGAVVWVFHGCPDVAGNKSICTGGFKVGGQDGHPISNGAACGQGVYSATGPDTPMGYGARSNSIILCKALVGEEGRQEVGDHWKPNGDWMIFKTAAQLLPKYVVHF